MSKIMTDAEFCEWFANHDDRGFPLRPFERIPRPTGLVGEEVEVYDWLAQNGIEEWLPTPDRLTFHLTADNLTYTSWVWHVTDDGQDCRGWEGQWIATEIIDGSHTAGTCQRTVPLAVPMPERVRTILIDAGASVIGP